VRLEFQNRAEDDIIRQFRYFLVDQDAPAVAIRFREAVMTSVQQLRAHPLIGTVVQRKGFMAIRIYYAVMPG